MAHLVERVGRAHGVENPFSMTLGISDGRRLYAVRYATDNRPGTLFHSQDMRALRELNPKAAGFSDDARAVVSEPFGTLSESWTAIPASTAIIVEGGSLEKTAFAPRAS